MDATQLLSPNLFLLGSLKPPRVYPLILGQIYNLASLLLPTRVAPPLPQRRYTPSNQVAYLSIPNKSWYIEKDYRRPTKTWVFNQSPLNSHQLSMGSHQNPPIPTTPPHFTDRPPKQGSSLPLGNFLYALNAKLDFNSIENFLYALNPKFPFNFNFLLTRIPIQIFCKSLYQK